MQIYCFIWRVMLEVVYIASGSLHKLDVILDDVIYVDTHTHINLY